MLFYDVRAYYAIEGSYADPYYISTFGEQLWKINEPRQETESNPVAPATSFEIIAFPNPFNSTTTLCYKLKETSDVTLVIGDILGRTIIALVEGEQMAGNYHVPWSAVDAMNNKVPSGLYCYQFIAITKQGKDVFRQSGKLLLVK